MNLKTFFPEGLIGIIYDCDGVMIDSAEANRHLYNLILGKLGLPPITPQQEAYAFQATFEQALKLLVPTAMQDRIEAACKTLDYDRDVLPKIRLMPGYRQFVEKAHAHGLMQAVDTNRTDFGAHRVITHFGLPHYFDPVITSSNSQPKPFPEGAEKICAAWSCKPSQALFVGDSPDDRAAAQGAGTRFAAFGPSDLAGDIKVVSWRDLENLLWPENNS